MNIFGVVGSMAGADGACTALVWHGTDVEYKSDDGVKELTIRNNSIYGTESRNEENLSVVPDPPATKFITLWDIGYSGDNNYIRINVESMTAVFFSHQVNFDSTPTEKTYGGGYSSGYYYTAQWKDSKYIYYAYIRNDKKAFSYGMDALTSSGSHSQSGVFVWA